MCSVRPLEGSAPLLQALDDGEEVFKRSRDAVELVDDPGVAALEVSEEFVEDGSAQCCAGPLFFVDQIDACFRQSIDLRARFLLLSGYSCVTYSHFFLCVGWPHTRLSKIH